MCAYVIQLISMNHYDKIAEKKLWLEFIVNGKMTDNELKETAL